LSPEPLLIGTDGACHGNPGPAGWAWVRDDGAYHAGSLAHGTNNLGELLGIRNAIVDHPDAEIRVLSDSQYAIKCVTEWGPSWRRKGTKNKANQELIYEIIDLVEARPADAQVSFQWVRGHDASNATPLNTAADRLATEFAGRRRDSDEFGTTTIDRTRYVRASASGKATTTDAAGDDVAATKAPAKGASGGRTRSSSGGRAPKPFAARHAGRCPECGESYPAGTSITKTPNGWGHPGCA